MSLVWKLVVLFVVSVVGFLVVVSVIVKIRLIYLVSVSICKNSINKTTDRLGHRK